MVKTAKMAEPLVKMSGFPESPRAFVITATASRSLAKLSGVPSSCPMLAVLTMALMQRTLRHTEVVAYADGTAVEVVPEAMVRAQLIALAEDLPPAALKTGMLAEAALAALVFLVCAGCW